MPEGGYAERTARNVREADGTAIFHGGTVRGGTAETLRCCAEMRRPFLLIDASEASASEAALRLAEFVRRYDLRVLNVAGPRASDWPDGYGFVLACLGEFLRDHRADTRAPRLSFIVPAHNEEHELLETLRAIQNAAGASQQRYEIIVVDDVSTDATAEIARQLGARVETVNLRQIAAVRNAGARVAQGDILFFVDADTRITPGHVAAGVAALERGCSGGSARVIMDGEFALWARVFLRCFGAAYFAGGFAVGAFIFTRRANFEAVGGFDEQYFAGEEVFITLALKKLGRFQILREPIVTSARKMRMHSPGFVLAQLFFVFFGGQRALRKREKLHLWYDGKREGTRPEAR